MPTHAERRTLPFTPDQLFALVADVEKYPEFLPWCVGARIRRRQGNEILADLIVGFKMFRERFTSRVTLTPSDRIDVAYSEGPFKYLDNHWLFEADGKGGCIIDFYVDFEFRSRVLQSLIGMVFNEAVSRMVSAFEKRARDLYADEA